MGYGPCYDNFGNVKGKYMYKKRSEVFDANFVYFLLIAFFVVIRIVSSTFKVSSEFGYVLNIIIQVGLMFSLPLFVFSALRKQKIKHTLKSFGFKKINFKAIIYSVVIGILVYFLTVCISSFFSLILTLLGYDPSYGGSTAMTSFPIWLLFVELFFTAVLPGFCEEVAHRGMLVSAYKPMGIKKAVLLSGLLFGLMHLNIEQCFYATIIGFLFGFVSIITDSIFPTMIMHFVNNALSVLFTFARVNGSPIGGIFDYALDWCQSTGPFLAFVIIFLVIAFAVLLLGFFVAKLLKETRLHRISELADTVVKQQLRQQLFQGTSLENQPTQSSENGEIEVEQRSTVGSKVVFDVKLVGDLFMKRKYKPTFKDNIFMYGSMFLGVLITIFTFVWGVL